MIQNDPPGMKPRLSATLLVVRDDPFEILMVRRHAMAVFSSALVFPGGMVEPDDYSDAWLELIEGAEDIDVDERALRIAALRETYEEAAILPAHGVGGDVGGNGVASNDDGPDTPFRQYIRHSGGTLMLGDIHRFGHWITPEGVSKRYDTHFFLCRATDGQEAVCDGGETVALEWVRPRDALARADEGQRSILFPTRLNLLRLAESDDSHSAIEAARVRPAFTVLPRIEQRERGTAVVIPEEAGYGVTENYYPSDEE